jgi:hypothetical protein
MSIETKDWIALGAALGGALIVAIGWFVTGSLNRSKDVAQRRLEFRLLALESFLPVWFIIQGNSAPFTNPNFLDKLENARSKFQLYGLSDEIEIFEALVAAIQSKNLPAANSALSQLVPLVRDRIRRELAINA